MEQDRIEVGLRLPVAGPLSSVESVTTIAREADALGFDALWVHDYIVWTRELDRTHISCGRVEMIDGTNAPQFHESLTTLSYVAGITSDIRIGTAVLVLPYRNPVIAARQLANLDNFSGGRLIVGVGVGAPRQTKNQDFEVLGISRSEKYERAHEALDVFEQIWTEPVSSYNGKYVSFEEQEFFPKPLQQPRPPIWIAGKSDRGLQLVAEKGDGWLPTWLTPSAYEEKITDLYRRAAEAGRGEHRFSIGNEIVACIAESSEEARSVSEATVRTLTAGFTVSSFEQAVETSAIGSIDEVTRTVNSYAAVGVTHLEMKPIYKSVNHMLEQMHMLSEEVFPHLEIPAEVGL